MTILFKISFAFQIKGCIYFSKWEIQLSFLLSFFPLFFKEMQSTYLTIVLKATLTQDISIVLEMGVGWLVYA